MKNSKLKSGSVSAWVLRAFLIFNFAFLIFSARAAEQFGDVSVQPGALYTGNTFHGYAEIRVLVENHSASRAHVVTLTLPNQAWNNGNSISRITRSVKLEPEARELVSILQPPLAVQGDNAIRVEIDGRREGEVNAPNANTHCNFYSGRNQMGTVFVSRSLDFDAVEKVFHANSGSFTASKAIGAPDAGGRGYQANCWMPDTRSYGRSNWLELDYSAPQLVNKVVVRNTQSPVTSGSVILIGEGGTNLAKISMSTGRNTSPGSGWDTEYSFPETKLPVKTVRLDFGKSAPHMISIDAVQIAGSTGSQWAFEARANSDNSASAPSYLGGSASAESVQSLRAESSVADWSGNWLAYTPFDVVVLNAADLGAMPPPVFAALGDYLHAGGNVVVLGKNSLPDAWHSAQSKKLPDGVENDIGFGSCFTFNPENPAALSGAATTRLRETIRSAALYWQNLPDENGANSLLSVVENLKIPTRGIVIIMLLFIILIGPVNLIYLNRIGKRTWMLWTIPVISFATTLLVFAYSLLREGVTPDTRIAGLTVLDQAAHRAATIGGTAFYCPLTPSGGLKFEYGTEATPLVQHGYGSGASREVDWTQAQQFTRGWVSARVPAHFQVRKSETRRERIQVANEGGKISIVNSLGAEIKSLWIADADMNIYEAKNIPVGQKGGLILSTVPAPHEKLGASGLLRNLGFAAHPDALGDGAAQYLLPGSYIAVLAANPFIENALGSAASSKRTKSSSIVFGVLGAEDNLGGAK